MCEFKQITASLNRNLPDDKWKFLYDYARKSLDEDIKRFQSIDNKAGKFLTLVSAVFAVFSAITPWIIRNKIPPTDTISWILLIAVGVTFIALVSSWSLLFRAIKLAKVPRMPLTDSVLDMFWGKDFPDIYLALTKSCRVALEENRKITDIKGNLIRKAYAVITFSAWLVAADVVLIVISKLSP